MPFGGRKPPTAPKSVAAAPAAVATPAASAAPPGPGPRAKQLPPKSRPAPTMTKAKMRQTVRDMLARNRKAGMPDDGIAEIVTQWVMAHLTRGTRVIP